MDRSSDGKLVNVGNFKSDGVNVNDNKPDNRDDNLGSAFSRSLGSALKWAEFLVVQFC